MYTKFKNIQNESIVIGKNSDYLSEVIIGRAKEGASWTLELFCILLWIMITWAETLKIIYLTTCYI